MPRASELSVYSVALTGRLHIATADGGDFTNGLKYAAFDTCNAIAYMNNAAQVLGEATKELTLLRRGPEVGGA